MKSKLMFNNEKLDKISTYDQKMRNRLNGLVDRVYGIIMLDLMGKNSIK